MNAKELKKLAEENGVEYKKTWSGEKVLDALVTAGVQLPQEPEIEEHVEDIPAPKTKKNDAARQALKDLELDVKKIRSISDRKLQQAEMSRLKRETQPLIEELKKSGDVNGYVKVLQFMRSRQMIDKKKAAEKGLIFELNELEAKQCDMTCRYMSDIGASRPGLDLGNDYPYTKYFDESRQQDMYIVFGKEVKQSQDQISPELEQKMKLKLRVEDGDHAPPKTIWHRHSFAEKQFFRFFEVI